MSLINEALKRTRDASYQPASMPPPNAPNYRLGNTRAPGAFWSRLKILIAAAIGSVMIVITIWLWSAVTHHRVVVSADSTMATAKAPETGATTPAPAPERVVVAAVPAAKVAEAPEPPKLVLQGITIDGAVREAMINGSNLREGEDIEGARIVAIESRRVRLQLDGREIVLRMP